MKRFLSICVLALVLSFPEARAQSVLDNLGLSKITGKALDSSIPLSQDQMVGALKEALSKGVKGAIGELGRPNGFFTNAALRIPMPEKLQTVEKTLRALKQEKMADDFVLTMNRAAEQAVPVTVDVFADVVKQMSITDARNILTGPTNAATQYFRKVTATNLTAKFLPIVKKATADNKVTGAYKKMMGKSEELTSSDSFGGFLKSGASLVNTKTVDVDAYVTDKALDSLFKLVAIEEGKIRQNPAERTTQLLQKVFGAVK